MVRQTSQFFNTASQPIPASLYNFESIVFQTEKAYK
jgi:hypothetical protein